MRNLRIIFMGTPEFAYRERVYGTTNIERWKHGLLLLRMAALAAGRLKFV